MQNTRTNRLSDAFAWVELTYSSLKLDTYLLIGAIVLTIILMCAGAYQEAVRQASLFLAVIPQQEATLMQVVNLINGAVGEPLTSPPGPLSIQWRGGDKPQRVSTTNGFANSIINQYGLGLLIAICYFSNVSESGKRRELLLDVLCIAAGVLVPQLVFHVSWLYTAQGIINIYGLTVSPEVVNTIGMEWFTVWGLSMIVGLVAL